MKKRKVLILGSSGMLGHKLFQYLDSKKTILVYGASRKNVLQHDNYISLNLECGFEGLKETIDSVEPDVIINCVGAIKQKEYSLGDLFFLNTSLPLFIDDYSKVRRFRFIHISTDCVFDGQRGDYSEESLDYSYDCYGLSKRLGETISDHNLVIRTSIIGHEINGKLSLLDWFLSADDEVQGYSNVMY
ncbi:sugar nucleotide-binding protein, partial [Pseudomonadales bacterium]|nr:sugar nucleotide-binding protein [Pseudomonadales bacterium]